MLELDFVLCAHAVSSNRIRDALGLPLRAGLIPIAEARVIDIPNDFLTGGDPLLASILTEVGVITIYERVKVPVQATADFLAAAAMAGSGGPNTEATGAENVEHVPCELCSGLGAQRQAGHRAEESTGVEASAHQDPRHCKQR